jgi:hypothetical protein
MMPGLRATAIRAAVLALLGAPAACSAIGMGSGSGDLAAGPATSASGPVTSGVPSTPIGTPTTGPDGESDAASTPTSSAPARSETLTAGLSAADRLAGLETRTFGWSAGGTVRAVPGSSTAPGEGRIYRVRVEVESGIRLDRQAFAAHVLDTLNDRRSWTENGTRRFARTDGPADIRVVLASPAKSAAICAPLRTFGKLSCRHGDEAVLTMYRWVKGIQEYSGDLDGYRRYVVNHEVGHLLGHAHEYCAGEGKRAPVMMQQTKGLKGCTPNPWPFPDAD